MKRIFASLFILLCTVDCDWEKAIKINGATSNYSHGMFADEDTGCTFIFYGKNTYKSSNIVSHLCYQIYDYENELKKENCILQKQFIESVSADGKGKSMYVLFNARRKAGGEQCTSTATDGCYDVFFTEAKDAGKTWSTPLPIPHPNNQDPYHRIYPQLIFIKETGRILVTYLQKAPNQYHLRYSTRPKDSSVFQEERPISSSTHEIENLQLVYRHGLKDLTIQLYFQSEGNLMYLNTVTNGAKWVLRNRQKLAKTGKYRVAISHNEERAFLVTSEGNELVVSWEEPDLSWHYRTYTQLSVPVGYCPILASVPKKDKKMMFTASMELSKANTYYFDTEYEELYDLSESPPLCSNRGSVSFSYYGENIAHFLAASGENIIMLTYTFS